MTESNKSTQSSEGIALSTSTPLVLVDGSSYLFRAFHALPPLANSRGHPTGAVKGVISMIRSLIKGYPGSHTAIIFDAKGKTFRHEVYEAYKATRPSMPPELAQQIPPIHDIIRAMGLPLLIIDNVEADDVIGTLADRAGKAGIDTIISTGDKDLAQLVNKHVTLINTMTNEALDIEGVEAKFGIPPDRIIDYLALTGDKSDNIPGVPGVGPKTAVKWLQQYGDVNGVIANANEIKGKIGERLRESIELVRLSYELATVKCDCELDFDIDNLVAAEPDNKKLYQLFSELEFKSWIAELEQGGVAADAENKKTDRQAPATIAPERIDYRLVCEERAFNDCVAKLETANEFALSLESEPGHFMQARILGIAVSVVPGEAFYIPLAHDRLTCPAQLDEAFVLRRLKPLLESKRKVKMGHDLKLISHLLANHDIQFAPFKFDVMLASYVLNSIALSHQYEAMAKHYLEVTPVDIAQLQGKGRKKLFLGAIEIEPFADYAAEKADLILRLSIRLRERLAETGKLQGLYDYYECPLIPVLQKMERTGIEMDAKVLRQQSGEIALKLKELEQKVFALAGEQFNLGSPKQLQTILYEKLELPVVKKTKTGQPSTAEPVLQELALKYELPQLILVQRGLAKLKSTYTDKLPLEIKPGTGRIHSTFQQAVAATGRLSSTEPNLQNIPIRTAEGRRIRQAFISRPGYKMLAADYSQVELRIMAHLSGDRSLLDAFSGSRDVHKATAGEVFGVELDEVTADQRRKAKAINFGLIYGMSAFGLANQLNISRSEAQEYVERYFERYPGVRRYMEQTQAQADETGYVETLFGRRLYLPDIRAGNAILRKAAQRTAINAPMQGTAADIIKRAMIDVDHWLRMDELDARLLLQVHDELVFEVKDSDIDLVAEGVRFRMITAASLAVPLVVDIGVGANWDEAH
ncbi:MAG: DNA polymerase I [Pseudohongiellaceae bacterium]